MSPHRLFGEYECVLFLAFVPSLQNSAANERQFLQADAISPAENQIRSYRKPNPDSIRCNAFKSEDTKFPVLGKACEKKLHRLLLNHCRIFADSGKF